MNGAGRPKMSDLPRCRRRRAELTDGEIALHALRAARQRRRTNTTQCHIVTGVRRLNSSQDSHLWHIRASITRDSVTGLLAARSQSSMAWSLERTRR